MSATLSSPPDVKIRETECFIDGKWVPAASGKTFATINPATEEEIAQIAEGDAEDVDAAAKAARHAFDNGPWSKMDARDRGRLMYQLADRMEAEIDDLARLETLDNGKPFNDSRNVDLPLAIDCLRYYAGYADKIHGSTIPIRGNHFCYTRREPIGVAGQIIPWNFPILMTAWKWGPALAAGCTIVMKPAEQTPLTCLRMAQLAQEVGIPDGVINVVPGYGPTAGAAVRQASVDRQDRVHRRTSHGPNHHARVGRYAQTTDVRAGRQESQRDFCRRRLGCGRDGCLRRPVPEPGTMLLCRQPCVCRSRASTTSSWTSCKS